MKLKRNVMLDEKSFLTAQFFQFSKIFKQMDFGWVFPAGTQRKPAQ
jgi:hypothetical protein